MPQNSLNNPKGTSAVEAFFRGKRTLILGFGREGHSSYAFLRSILPDAILGIADARTIEEPDTNCRIHSGPDYLAAMIEYDIVLKSPGIAFVDVVVPHGVTVTCQTDIFLRFAPCAAIGVTGTKGKTTTSTLIYEMLCASGVSAILAGNMGLPVLDYWQAAQSPGTVFVLELSSHQLEFTNASPHVAVWTNLYPEHLDHYQTGFSGYLNAKRNILKHQNAEDYYVFCNAESPDTYLGSLHPRASPCSVKAPEMLPFPVSDRLKGKHNLTDVALAARAAALLGASEEGIAKAALAFKGVEHRMEPIGTFAGITFVDDCIATVPAATLAALEALPTCRTLIFGGQDRGIDYGPFCTALSLSQRLSLIALPDTGHSLAPRLRELGMNIIVAEDMEDAVNSAFSCTQMGEICLLSPAAPSYNIYRDFEEKAEHFQALVRGHSRQIQSICG
ncbi:MAG: UDP-N-acetylmuramoyl-L-alanine--D-glutamate ligase [Oscillospiraceae bacterium]|jgi:UDP-N-acetylmuramoylalanine--D-glutamate ligase|nr:UDP-N-acetylmuramoyl-L-alanine--D-glutamate ligase [Oscillospiraceae bacterium]